MRFRDDHPRPHHYRYAHRLLSRILVKPEWELRRMAQAGFINEFLHFLWTDYAKAFPEEERLSPDGLAGELSTAGTTEVLLVTMPPALHVTEAHFVAVAPCEPAPARRYWTLEHSWTFEGEPCTVLGQWADGSHLNLGPGPEPTADAFLAALARMGG
jgi:hypothetical protein